MNLRIIERKRLLRTVRITINPEIHAPTDSTDPDVDAKTKSFGPQFGDQTQPIDLEVGAQATHPEDNAKTTPSHPKVGAQTTSIDPEVGAQTTPIDPKVGAQTTSIDPEVGAQTTPIDPEVGAQTTSIDPEVGAQTTPIDPEVGAQTTPIDPEVGAQTTPIDPEVGAQTTSIDPEVGAQTTPIDPEVGATIEPVDFDNVSAITTNKTKESIEDIDRCAKENIDLNCTLNTCQGRCGQVNNYTDSTWLSLCSCDDECNEYGDCCKDYRDTCVNETTITRNQKPLTQIHEDELARGGSYECRNIGPGRYVYMIYSCSPGYKDHDIVEKCHSTSNIETDVRTMGDPGLNIQLKTQSGMGRLDLRFKINGTRASLLKCSLPFVLADGRCILQEMAIACRCLIPFDGNLTHDVIVAVNRVILTIFKVVGVVLIRSFKESPTVLTTEFFATVSDDSVTNWRSPMIHNEKVLQSVYPPLVSNTRYCTFRNTTTGKIPQGQINGEKELKNIDKWTTPTSNVSDEAQLASSFGKSFIFLSGLYVFIELSF
ncbi:unnamed protein product [Owenia fusiformis]|uniref:Uncharacterized protein n=1 Tax=Owenia fusiformis TaxID=6347 RepID=A0A8J1V0N5_OWEFU|nr:unnamed protein product [Owenia fusiformis]